MKAFRPFGQEVAHRRREYKAVAMLRAHGYEVVRVQKGGVCHLVAFGPREVKMILIQTSNALDASRLRAMRVPGACRREIWSWHTFRHKPEIEVVE